MRIRGLVFDSRATLKPKPELSNELNNMVIANGFYGA